VLLLLLSAAMATRNVQGLTASCGIELDYIAAAARPAGVPGLLRPAY
jgi:hypothetical protein